MKQSAARSNSDYQHLVAGFSKFIALALPCLESAPCGGVLQIFISYHYRLHCIPARVRPGGLGN